MTYQINEWRRTEIQGAPLYNYTRLVRLLIAGLEVRLSDEALAAALNEFGMLTPVGKQWEALDVYNVMTCLQSQASPDAVHPDNYPPEMQEALSGYLSEVELALGELVSSDKLTSHEEQAVSDYIRSGQDDGECGQNAAAIQHGQVLLTDASITAGATNRFGWNYEQLAVLGVRLPPRKGWKTELIGTYVSREKYLRFLTLATSQRVTAATHVGAQVLH